METIRKKEKNMNQQEIEQALKNREIKVYLQPQFDLATEKLVGAESLVRWQRGAIMVPPSSFIPFCEQTGFITKVDQYVLETVCQHMQKWKQKIPIAVNESRRHLYNPHHVEELEQTIKKYGIEAKYIELEMTETAVVHDIEAAKEAERKVHALGFKVAMDDFGTGYSSFSMLRQIEIDILKIDRSFVHEVTQDERGKIIIEAIIGMAKKLNITTIAEGIETKEQAQYLKTIGCDIAQGYYYALPMAIEEFERKYLA